MLEVLLGLSWLLGHWHGLSCLSLGLLVAALTLRRHSCCLLRAWKPLAYILIDYGCSGSGVCPFEAMASNVCSMCDTRNWSFRRPCSSFLRRLLSLLCVKRWQISLLVTRLRHFSHGTCLGGILHKSAQHDQLLACSLRSLTWQNSLGSWSAMVTQSLLGEIEAAHSLAPSSAPL